MGIVERMVRGASSMTGSDFTNSIIALSCWRAAQHELHHVMLAVLMVFRNRAQAGWYEGDLYRNSYAWLMECSGDFPDQRDPQFQQLLAKMDAVIDGRMPDKTGGATWFCPTTQLSEKIEGTITTTIGGMTFVK